ncbi:hypothetical protein BG015_009944 [Linnemannia schmuckeri]|uniref:Uncharacterized protein n=1 Tax=Linnemannia schmuckeri TaxID=64567 RepID=A0A9P5RV66_9FUNG|nr:hypothetical protein BG015_009944 [Linnemannia schmuckeri]
MLYFWRKVDDTKELWSRFLQPQNGNSGTLFETSRLDHAQHIRHLVVSERWLLFASVSAKITNLESFVIIECFSGRTYPDGKSAIDETPSEVTMPATVFDITPHKKTSKLYRRRVALQSQLCWQLVFNNPRLRSVEF